MLDTVANLLHHDCGLQETDLLLVGVSGGPDSLCLLHLLNRLCWHVVAAHFNHKLRLEAEEDANMVKAITGKMGIRLVAGEGDVSAYAEAHSLSIEEAARRLRYGFLFEQAQREGAQAVAVAHTADDQVETILMHILRGSGLAGLSGMPLKALPNAWSESIALVRPMLRSWRREVEEYLEEQGITAITDQSNTDTAYLRNRVRHQLLPELAAYNPKIKESLLRLGEIVDDEELLIAERVENAWRRVLARNGDGYVVIKRTEYLHLPRAIQRRLLRQAIAMDIPGLVDVDFDCIERGINFVAQGAGSGQVDLSAGVTLALENDHFKVVAPAAVLPIEDFPAVRPGEQLYLDVPGRIELANGWQLEAEVELEAKLAFERCQGNTDPFDAWLDGDSLGFPLVVRVRKTGDRMQPLGMQGHTIKLSDVMVNLKLPSRARRYWPLVCSNGEIAWLPGYRQSQATQVTRTSRRIVHLSLHRKPDPISAKD